MQIDWELLANFTVAMLAIVNPLEKIPLWVAASQSEQRRFQWLLASLVVVTCSCILLFFLWFGQLLLFQLKIDLASFKIGGGLILLQFGFSMMKGTAIKIRKDVKLDSASTRDKVLQRYQQIFVPIGVPVIAGPGAITTVIIYGQQSDSLLNSLLLGGVILFVLLILFLTLLGGTAIHNVTGDLPLDLISRIFGMILIAISIQFMVEGLTNVFPGWVQNCS
ncbi:MAG: MarC family protein [Desulforhopalus sp.]